MLRSCYNITYLQFWKVIWCYVARTASRRYLSAGKRIVIIIALSSRDLWLSHATNCAQNICLFWPHIVTVQGFYKPLPSLFKVIFISFIKSGLYKKAWCQLHYYYWSILLRYKVKSIELHINKLLLINCVIPWWMFITVFIAIYSQGSSTCIFTSAVKLDDLGLWCYIKNHMQFLVSIVSYLALEALRMFLSCMRKWPCTS